MTKSVTGPGSAGPYQFTTACTQTSNSGTVIPVPLPDTDATFELSDGQNRTITAPKNASCIVREADVPAGDTVTYNGQNTAPTLRVESASTLDIVNSFPTSPPTTTTPTSPTTTTTPTTTAPPTSPTTPTGPGTTGGAVAPPPSTTGPGGNLSYTGVNLVAPIGAGLILLILGAALYLWGRRRPEHQ